ncbi:MAG: SAM-dependent methyltransferase [Bacteroidetes bacterium]|nr:SAM-dependent methyltransferase [Bacteroidota bacterium]
MYNIAHIGFVTNRFGEPADPFDIRKEESLITVYDEYAEGLFRIEEHSHLEIIFRFHLAEDYQLKTHVRSGELKGVFASRSPHRTSSIGTTVVKLIEKYGNSLKVTGLDALNGSPVLDIKPVDFSVYREEEAGMEEMKRKYNPRFEIDACIRSGNLARLMSLAAQIHGHYCPGLAMGIMAGAHAMKMMTVTSDGLEDLIAVTETNNCFSDGIQFTTGCTFGNNSLVFHDLGKVAFTLTGRSGNGLRIASLPSAREYIRNTHPWFSERYKKVVKDRKRSDEEIAAFKREGIEAAFAILKLDFNRIFSTVKVQTRTPDYAPSNNSIDCDRCGESTMDTRTVLKETGTFCIKCAGEDFGILDGTGIRNSARLR